MTTDNVSDRQLRALDLAEGETVQAAWIGGIAHGKTSNTTKVGGSLVLTDRRLIFQPVKLPTGTIGWRDQRWIDGYGFSLGFDEISEIAVDSVRRAALQIRSADGEMAINIGHSRFTPVWSKKNIAARDHAFARIQAAVG